MAVVEEVEVRALIAPRVEDAQVGVDAERLQAGQHALEGGDVGHVAGDGLVEDGQARRPLDDDDNSPVVLACAGKREARAVGKPRTVGEDAPVAPELPVHELYPPRLEGELPVGVAELGEEVAYPLAVHACLWVHEARDAALEPNAGVAVGHGGEHVEEKHRVQGVRVRDAHAVHHLHHAGRAEEAVERECVAEVEHMRELARPAVGLLGCGHVPALGHRPVLARLRVEREIAALLARVDARLPVDHTPEVGRHGPCPLALAHGPRYRRVLLLASAVDDVHATPPLCSSIL